MKRTVIIGAVAVLVGLGAVVALVRRPAAPRMSEAAPTDGAHGAATNVAGTTPTTLERAPSENVVPSGGSAAPKRSLLPAGPVSDPSAPAETRDPEGTAAAVALREGPAPNEGEELVAKVWTPDREGIRGAVRESTPELKDCYEQWIKLEPNMAGKLAVSFAITSEVPDGGDPSVATVQGVKIASSELAHPFMEGCVQSVFSNLRFSPPEGGEMKVTYPIKFSNDAPDAG